MMLNNQIESLSLDKRPVLLFIDATIRPPEISRTFRLCQAYLDAFLKVHPEYVLCHRILREEKLLPNTLNDISLRDSLIDKGELSNSVLDLATEFAAADQILIGAPYWDLSFPAILKIYLEKVCVAGITFRYTEQGVMPLCRAKRMTYLTACGGKLIPELNFGAHYLRGLSTALFGIARFQAEAAELLDVVQLDAETEMLAACARAETLAIDNIRNDVFCDING